MATTRPPLIAGIRYRIAGIFGGTDQTAHGVYLGTEAGWWLLFKLDSGNTVRAHLQLVTWSMVDPITAVQS